MSSETQDPADILMGDVIRLEQVVSRESLTKICQSFFELFRLPVRVISYDGDLLADVHREQELCRYLNQLENGQAACTSTVGAVRHLEPTKEPIIHPCFTGAVYRVVPLQYQGRPVGRFVIGPYVPFEDKEVPQTLLSVDPDVDPKIAAANHAKMPRVNAAVADQLADHMQRVLDLLLFSGHRAQLASTMQIANVRENYRELAQKTDKLEKAYEELKQLDKLKSNFLATVSHELRTPLTSIIGYAEMLESGQAGELADEQGDLLKTIRGKADQLLAMISDLLDLGRLEAETLTINRESIDAEALLADVGTTVAPAANKKNVSVDVRVEGELPALSGDPMRLKQVLVNLADNAVKFTPEGGSVELIAEPTEVHRGGGGGDGFGTALFSSSKQAVAFVVRDTGIGIDAESLPKIFDAFYQADGSATRQHGGTGLGLSIAKQLVEAHDGTIDVQSDVGKGTIFVVTIPVG